MVNIELISCESGDWEVLKIDDRVLVEGHSIRSRDWVELIKYCFECEVKIEQISDEDMEYGRY
jgi:hypothetical protein